MSILASIQNLIGKIAGHLGFSQMFSPSANTVLSKDVIKALTEAPYGFTPNEIEDVRFWWREGIDALHRAESDPIFGIGEQIDAEVVSNHGDFGDPERVLQFAQAAEDTQGDHRARVRRCIAVGLANTDKDFGVLRGRVLLTKLAGRGAPAAWAYVQANAGNVWTNWVLPLLRLELAVVAGMFGLWAVTFGAIIVGWFCAESRGMYGLGYLLVLLGVLNTLFTFTIPVQIVDGTLTVIGAPMKALKQVMREAGIKEEEQPGPKEIRWGLHMIYFFRWRAVLGVLIASGVNHILMGTFGVHPEVWWLTFGSLVVGIAVAVILQQEGRATDRAAKAYYRASRIGLTAIYPLLVLWTIWRLGVHGDLSPDGTWLVRTGLEVARVPLRYTLFQSVTTGMVVASALGAILALAFRKWAPAAALGLAAVVLSGMVSISVGAHPPTPAPAPISAWEDPSQSPLHNGDIAGPTPATAAPTTATTSPPDTAASSDARRARAKALRERARK